jgi:cytidyltransferase-like protein
MLHKNIYTPEQFENLEKELNPNWETATTNVPFKPYMVSDDDTQVAWIDDLEDEFNDQDEKEKEHTFVYTGGTFDLFHPGHVDLLKECSRYGKVIVALNTDEFVKEYKGKKPVMFYEERFAMLFACKYVYGIVKNFGGADSRPVIERVKPSYIAIGSDWLEKDYLKQMNIDAKFLEENEIRLIYLPRPADDNRISSTEIKKRIKNNETIGHN